MIHVIAVITAKPGMREAVLKAAHANIPKVLAEDGCLAYEVFADATGFGSFQAKFGADTLVYIEKWASPEALMAHAAAPHMVEYGRTTKDLLAERAVHILSPA